MSTGPIDELTDLLRAWSSGGREAEQSLIEAVYRELVQVARRMMDRERSNHTLQPTALVHEVYLKLADDPASWQDRRHFFAVAAMLMRRILVDHARGVGRDKRGGGLKKVELRDDDRVDPGLEVDFLALDRALGELGERSPEAARMVELSYFGGLSYEEIADLLATSRATVGRELRFAKAWLGKRLKTTT